MARNMLVCLMFVWHQIKKNELYPAYQVFKKAKIIPVKSYGTPFPRPMVNTLEVNILFFFKNDLFC